MSDVYKKFLKENAYRKLYHVPLQVHDELFWNTPAGYRVYLNPPCSFSAAKLEEAQKALDEVLAQQFKELWMNYWNVDYKVSMENKTYYRLYNETHASFMSHKYTSEDSARADAERYAKERPGTDWVVLRAVSKSHVAPAPSITTRLA